MVLKNIVGIRFKRLGKIYFFDPQYLVIKKDELVILESDDGEDIGTVAIPNRKISEDKITAPLKKVLRIANPRDLRHYEECKKKEKDALEFCNKRIKALGLKMSLTDVECKFDNTKLMFFFTADGRIDFRDLVKDLAAQYRTRIELRQIGVRDEIKRLGGNGICGKELCCCSFLSDFETVSIKMAKNQNLALNPTKISGNCGRLMCCLKYEDEVYQEKLARLPHIGALVKTPDGTGEIDSVETLAEVLRVRFKDGDVYKYKKYSINEIKIIKDSDHVDEQVGKEEMEELKKLEQMN